VSRVQPGLAGCFHGAVGVGTRIRGVGVSDAQRCSYAGVPGGVFGGQLLAAVALAEHIQLPDNLDNGPRVGDSNVQERGIMGCTEMMLKREGSTRRLPFRMRPGIVVE
jgi:hypothetical protein